jgi:hypothetical protein
MLQRLQRSLGVWYKMYWEIILLLPVYRRNYRDKPIKQDLCIRTVSIVETKAECDATLQKWFIFYYLRRCFCALMLDSDLQIS